MQTWVPAEPVVINRAHPIARNMTVAWAPRMRRNLLVPAQNWAFGSSAALVPTQFGMASTHDGASDNFSIELTGPAMATSDGSGSGDFTMMCWANPFSEARASGLFTQRQASPAIIVGLFANCTISFGASAGTFAGITFTTATHSASAASMVNGTMRQYAMTRDGTSLTIFVDGLDRASSGVTVLDVYDAGQSTKIGGSAQNTSSFFADAQIPFAFAWNRALSYAEVAYMFAPATRFEIFRQASPLRFDILEEGAPPTNAMLPYPTQRRRMAPMLAR